MVHILNLHISTIFSKKLLLLTLHCLWKCKCGVQRPNIVTQSDLSHWPTKWKDWQERKVFKFFPVSLIEWYSFILCQSTKLKNRIQLKWYCVSGLHRFCCALKNIIPSSVDKSSLCEQGGKLNLLQSSFSSVTLSPRGSWGPSRLKTAFKITL